MKFALQVHSSSIQHAFQEYNVRNKRDQICQEKLRIEDLNEKYAILKEENII